MVFDNTTKIKYSYKSGRCTREVCSCIQHEYRVCLILRDFRISIYLGG